MSNKPIFEFHSPFSTFEPGSIDKQQGIIRGVSVLTGGITAEGHDLDVDEETLTQVFKLGCDKGEIPVKENHAGGAGDIVGYITNFRRAGNQLRGDWNLIQSHPRYAQILETAERMPRGVGLSASFIGPETPFVGPDGRQKARCEKLLAVDYVTNPAANPNGLFQAKTTQTEVDNPRNHKMAGENSKEPTLADLQAQIQQLVDQNTTLQRTVTKMEHIVGDTMPSAEELAQMNEEQLAELGLTQEEVDSALEDLQAQIDSGEYADDPSHSGVYVDEAGNYFDSQGNQLDPDSVEGDDGGMEPAMAGGDAGADAGGADAGGVALNAINRRLIQLESHLEAKERAEVKAKITQDFNALNEALTNLQQERDDYKVKFEAAQTALQAGGGARASTNFDDLGLARGPEGHKPGSFEAIVTEFQSDPKVKSKGEAYRLAIKKDPTAFRAYLAKKNVISLEG